FHGAGQPFAAHRDDVTEDFDSEIRQKLFGEGADGHARRGFPGARPFEDVAGIVEAVLDRTGEIGMTWPGPGYGLVLRRGSFFDGKRLRPVFPIGIGDEDSDGRTDRAAMAHARNDMGAVRLDFHPAATAKALLTPPELVVNCILGDRDAGREPG